MRVGRRAAPGGDEDGAQEERPHRVEGREHDQDHEERRGDRQRSARRRRAEAPSGGARPGVGGRGGVACGVHGGVAAGPGRRAARSRGGGAVLGRPGGGRPRRVHARDGRLHRRQTSTRGRPFRFADRRVIACFRGASRAARRGRPAVASDGAARCRRTGVGQREQQLAWEAAGARRRGCPWRWRRRDPRPRVVSGAPLTQGMASDGELYEVFLDAALSDLAGARGAALNIRRGSCAARPGGRVAGRGATSRAGHRGGVRGADRRAWDRLQGRARASDRRAPGRTDPARERVKGDRRVAYDLRPFVDELASISADASDRVRLAMRLRHDPERGIGRPDEVLAELADRAGAIETVEIRRTALVLAAPKGVERAAAPPPFRAARRGR